MKRCALLFMLIFGTAAWAQHNNRSARDLQFRFGNPGARSLAFGGAFLALADDATAPVANPAGMIRTSKRSLSFELNYTELDNPIPFNGGTIEQQNLFEYDFNFTESEAAWDTFQVPYLAVVFPKNKWRYGFYAQKQANLEREYTTEPIGICTTDRNNPLPNHNCNLDNANVIFNASTDILDIEMDNLGFTFGSGLSEKFSWGMSLFYSKLDYQADSVVNFERIAGDILVEKLARGDDDGYGGIIGLLWQATPEFSVGATFKRQPEFDYEAILFSPEPLAGTPDNFVQIGKFKIPDSFGVGVSFRPTDVMTVNFDAVRVYYSQITDELIDFALADNPNNITQTMADITEIRVGLEYFFPQFANPLALRVGYFLDPYHAAVNNVEDSQLFEGTPGNVFVRDIFFLNNFEEDTNHYSAGFGITFGAKFQLDGAIDISDNARSATLSGIYRF